MSNEAISERVARERRKVLREEYGTDDAGKIAEIKAGRAKANDEFKARQEELDRLKKEKEDRERAAMTDGEKVALDLAAAKAEIETLKVSLAKAEEAVMAERQEMKLSQIASAAYIIPEALDRLGRDMARHYKSLRSAEQKRFDQKAIERWVKGWAKDHPRCVAQPEVPAATTTEQPAAPPAVAKPPVRRPVGAPAPQQQRQPPPRANSTNRAAGTNAAGKTVKPGLPNSMNQKELDAYYREKGMKKPY